MMKIAGIHSVEKALEKNLEIEKIFVLNKPSQSLNRIIYQANRKSIPVSFVPAPKLSSLYKGAHQGVVAIVSPIRFIDIDEMITRAFQGSEYPYFIMLDGITDTRNLGAIFRSAVAFNASGIILPAHHSASITEETVKTSAGGVFEIPVARVNHLADAIYLLKSYDLEIIAATEKAPKNLETYHFNKPVAFLMGNENKGISPSLLKRADTLLKININSKIDSLNVSVATAIFCYEYHRQKWRDLEK